MFFRGLSIGIGMVLDPDDFDGFKIGKNVSLLLNEKQPTKFFYEQLICACIEASIKK